MASKKSTGEEYAKMKIKVFLKVLEELKQKGYKFSLKHMACSAFVGEFPETILDIIRVGTLFYKIRHIEGFDLKSVMSLKSRVCFVKRVPAGSYISYGTLYRTEKETNIVVINIGYSDGLPRGLSKTGEVLIRGKRFPIAGFISMNNTMVDVGDEDIGVGEEVVIMGSQGQENISNDEISSKLQTSTGEFPTRLSHRIPRIYIGEKG